MEKTIQIDTIFTDRHSLRFIRVKSVNRQNKSIYLCINDTFFALLKI